VTTSHAFDDVADDAQFDALLERSSLGAPGARQLRERTAHAPEFEEFFRASFHELVKTAMFAGATREEAEDAVSATLADLFRIWPVPGYALSYARRAVVSNFIKDKSRGNQRIVRRLIERGHVPRESCEDDRLTAWEDTEWVADVLSTLPTAQREVMACIVRGLGSQEIAGELGKSREAVRRHLVDARERLAAELRHGPSMPAGHRNQGTVTSVR
jgi:RNA polymerase sigma factor (sigma-70 family)